MVKLAEASPDAQITVVDYGDATDPQVFMRAGMDNQEDLNDMLGHAAAMEGASLHTLKEAMELYAHAGIRKIATTTGIRRHTLRRGLEGTYQFTKEDYEKLNKFFSDLIELPVYIIGPF